MVNTEVYTDGSCSKTDGGWAFVVVNPYTESFGKLEDTTNNRAEMTAVIKALEFVKGNVTVYADSAYIVNAFNEGWLVKWKKNGWVTYTGKPVLNQDLWLTILDLCESRTVVFKKVAGHATNEMNIKCDKLANHGRKYC